MDIITLIIPLFLLIVLGYALKHYRFLNEEEASALNKVAFYIALPALLFSSIAQFSITQVFSLQLVATGIAVTILLFVFAYPLSWKMDPKKRGSFTTCCFRANLGYLGLPVVFAVLGQSGVAKAAILQGILVPVYVGLTIAILLSGKRYGLFYVFKKTVTNPLFVSTLLGILFSALSIPLPHAIIRAMDLLSDISLPLVLMVIGTRIDASNLKVYLSTNITSALFKLAIAPLTAFAVFAWLLPTDMETMKVGILMMAMPTAVATYSFAKEFDADDKLAASAVSFNTLLSLLTIPLIIYLLIYL
ncbi:AEC family transporter [Candidatus Woesearchaeota archaeon]|nr:AEC family transporter [Candidatus Woesearchaeota archaeon]